MTPEQAQAFAQIAAAARRHRESNDPGLRERNAVDPSLQSRIPGHTPAVGDVNSALYGVRAGGQGLANWGIDSSRLMEGVRDAVDPMSRALGAVVEGQNPLAAARGAGGYEVDGRGGYRRADPTLDEALIEKGVHPVAAILADALVTPDPIGAGRVADLAPLLGLIGAPGLRKMLTGAWSQVDFMPAGLLHQARGNELRRSPATQSAFRRELASSGGFNEPAIIIYDPRTGRMKVGEGNHRTFAAMEADSPVPTTAVQGRVAENEGMPLPPGGIEALARVKKERHGYMPGTAHPGQIGLETYAPEEVLEYAARMDESRMFPWSPEDEVEIRALLEQSTQVNDVMPRTGATLTRSSQAQPNFTATIQRAAQDEGFEGEAAEWVQSLVDELGPQAGLDMVKDRTGLTGEELRGTLEQWTQAYDAGNRGGIPESFYDPEFNALADEGAGYAYDEALFNREADVARGQLPDTPSPEVWKDLPDANMERMARMWADMEKRGHRFSPDEFDDMSRWLNEMERRGTGAPGSSFEEAYDLVSDIDRPEWRAGGAGPPPSGANLAVEPDASDLVPPTVGYTPDPDAWFEFFAKASRSGDNLPDAVREETEAAVQNWVARRRRDILDIRSKIDEGVQLPEDFAQDIEDIANEASVLLNQGVVDVPQRDEITGFIRQVQPDFDPDLSPSVTPDMLDEMRANVDLPDEVREELVNQGLLDADGSDAAGPPPDKFTFPTGRADDWDPAELAALRETQRNEIDSAAAWWRERLSGDKPLTTDEVLSYESFMDSIDNYDEMMQPGEVGDLYELQSELVSERYNLDRRAKVNETQSLINDVRHVVGPVPDREQVPGEWLFQQTNAPEKVEVWKMIYDQMGDEEEFLDLLKRGGLSDAEAALITEAASGSHRPALQDVRSGGFHPDVPRAGDGFLGEDMMGRLEHATEGVEEFMAITDAGIMTPRTTEQGLALHAELSSIIDDLQPLVGQYEGADEALGELLEARAYLNLRVDPLGPGGQ